MVMKVPHAIDAVWAFNKIFNEALFSVRSIKEISDEVHIETIEITTDVLDQPPPSDAPTHQD